MPNEFLNPKFLEAMNDIGRYGHEKYGALPSVRSEHANPARVVPEEIAAHSTGHYISYLNGHKHDHFNTRRHQLAAVAFNAMMEFYFAGLEDEQ